jgi:hypothetical protein
MVCAGEYGVRNRVGVVTQRGAVNVAGWQVATTVSSPFFSWEAWTSHVGLKSGTLSVEKVKGHIITSMMMSV